MLIILITVLYLPSLDYPVRLSASCTFSIWQRRQTPCSQDSNTFLERVADLAFSPPYALPFLQHKHQSPKHAHIYAHALPPSPISRKHQHFQESILFQLATYPMDIAWCHFQGHNEIFFTHAEDIKMSKGRKKTQLGQSIPIAVWRRIVQFVQDDNVFRFIESTSYSGNQSFKDVHYVYRREKKVKQQHQHQRKIFSNVKMAPRRCYS